MGPLGPKFGTLCPVTSGGGTVDGKNLATPGATGAQILSKLCFLVEGSRGAWGHHQSTRDEKISWGSYFREIWLDLKGFHADFDF